MENEEIKKELEASEQYNLETYNEKIYDLLLDNKKVKNIVNPERKLIKLSFENVAKIEAMLRYNSSYTNFYDDILLKNDKIDSKKVEEDVEQGKCEYSSTYYIKYIKKYKDNSNKIKNKEFYEKLIKVIVRTIDKENSTHLSSDGVGIKEISERICKYSIEELCKLLKSNKYELIGELSYPTNPENKKYNARTNFSFATKFCHYMSFNLFDDDNSQDKFSIYDKILSENLPLYFYHFKNYYKPKYEIKYNNELKNYFDKTEPYEIVMYNLNEVKELGKYDEKIKRYRSANSDEVKYYFIKKYKKYLVLIDEIREATKEENKSKTKISRNGLDHLIWYSSK